LKGNIHPNKQLVVFYQKYFTFRCTLTTLYLLSMRRNITRTVYNNRKNVNATTVRY